MCNRVPGEITDEQLIKSRLESNFAGGYVRMVTRSDVYGETKAVKEPDKLTKICNSIDRIEGMVQDFESLVTEIQGKDRPADSQNKAWNPTLAVFMSEAPDALDIKTKRLSECLAAIKVILF